MHYPFNLTLLFPSFPILRICASKQPDVKDESKKFLVKEYRAFALPVTKSASLKL